MAVTGERVCTLYKDPRGYTYALIDLDLLLPDGENPRIPVQESALETVLAMVAQDSDGLYALAKDIVEMHGNNPAELLNVSPRGNFYVVREGNRRLAVRKILKN
jgi:hypothetical protein